MNRLAEDRGLTLIELLATLVIAGIVMTIVITIGMFTVQAINTDLAFNAAQRTVLGVSSGITSILKRSDYVMVQYPAGTTLMTAPDIQLHTYENGYLPTSSQYAGGVYSGVGTSGLQGNYTDNGYIDFTAQDAGNLQSANTLWTVTYYDASGVPETLGTVNLKLDYPSSSQIQSGDFVNSLILDLSHTYRDGHGNMQVFDLTSGYHDKDLR